MENDFLKRVGTVKFVPFGKNDFI